VRAIGVLSSIGSWLVQDVKGETLLKLGVRGTWAEPALSGQIVFKDGGAYFPKTGLLLEDIQLRAELENDRLRIAELGLRSGPGELDGRGELTFDGWALSDFRLDIAGDKLQVVDFPELQVLASPKLSLSGTPERISLQGSILIPKLTYKGSRTVPEVLPSKDVVIATQKEQRQALSIATDVRVAVALGDEVTLKSGGIETSLTGDAMVTMGPTGEFLAKGEIQLVSGSFNAYGTTLQIRQGLLNYNGDPVTNPQLRIFAAREVGEILAGVQVTGYLEAPVVTLYSRPTMPERDILGYMLMGRAIKSDSQETDMLMMGAGTLMPTYGGALAQQLGITEIDIQGLFVGSGGLRLRRKLTEKWEVESTLGTESGIDLYYILEFE
jgi:translocation and assembly module TamB